MSSFDDFWASIIGSTTLLSPSSESALRAAMETIYNSNDPNAAAIISGLQNSGRRLASAPILELPRPVLMAGNSE
jgi:hypothetical protein